MYVCLSAVDVQLFAASLQLDQLLRVQGMGCETQTDGQTHMTLYIFATLSTRRSGERERASLLYKARGSYVVWVCPRPLLNFCAVDIQLSEDQQREPLIQDGPTSILRETVATHLFLDEG